MDVQCLLNRLWNRKGPTENLIDWKFVSAISLLNSKAFWLLAYLFHWLLTILPPHFGVNDLGHGNNQLFSEHEKYLANFLASVNSMNSNFMSLSSSLISVLLQNSYKLFPLSCFSIPTFGFGRMAIVLKWASDKMISLGAVWLLSI